jgi:hypothetical protein
MMFVNLENFSVHFDVLFFNDDGTDMVVPLVPSGTNTGGNVRAVSVTLGAACSIQFQTAGTSSVTRTGWALVSQDDYKNSIGGMAVFRQSVAGRPDFEAVVPVVSRFSGHFALYFDNVGYSTAFAIANPSSSPVTIPIRVHDQAGSVIQTQTFSLPPYGHTASSVQSVLPATAGRRGTIEVETSGYGVGALGLRFGSASFTSFQVLENFNWFMSR